MFFFISPSTCYNSVPLFIKKAWQLKENVDKTGKIYQYPPHLFFKSPPTPTPQSNKFNKFK